MLFCVQLKVVAKNSNLVADSPNSFVILCIFLDENCLILGLDRLVWSNISYFRKCQK